MIQIGGDTAMEFCEVLAAGMVVGQTCLADGFEERYKRFDPAVWSVVEYAFRHPSFDADWGADLVQADTGLVLRLEPQKGRQDRLPISGRRIAQSGLGLGGRNLKGGRGKGSADQVCVVRGGLSRILQIT
ncbi:MAG: hypothetical protein KUG74_13995 [Rhodobacteraceae bacterium]|nr:hypothetical protein [Paracoccaceae bacterium]